MKKLEILSEDEIVAEASKDSTYCQLSVDIGLWAARKQYERTLGQIKDWAIAMRAKLQEQKERHAAIKPHDIQALAVLGGKIKAFQQIIDKLTISEAIIEGT